MKHDSDPMFGPTAPRGDEAAYLRRQGILTILADAGPVGATYAEICDLTGQRGGPVTGALSNLHKEGLVCALRTGPEFPQHTRNGCGIYVLPQHRLGRLTREQGRGTKLKANDQKLVAALEKSLDSTPQDGIVRMTRSGAANMLALIKRLDA